MDQVIVSRMFDESVDGCKQINCCSNNSSDEFRQLSPFILGPCRTKIDGWSSLTMENAWQYSKLYKQHIGEDGLPTDEWYKWVTKGFTSKRAHRFPMGKGAKPECAYWDNKKLGYIDARKQIYIPLYTYCVIGTDALKRLKDLFNDGCKLQLRDYDGYRADIKGMNLNDVLHYEKRPMGHAFVLKMILEDFNLIKSLDL